MSSEMRTEYSYRVDRVPNPDRGCLSVFLPKKARVWLAENVLVHNGIVWWGPDFDDKTLTEARLIADKLLKEYYSRKGPDGSTYRVEPVIRR